MVTILRLCRVQISIEFKNSKLHQQADTSLTSIVGTPHTKAMRHTNNGVKNEKGNSWNSLTGILDSLHRTTKEIE